MPVCNKNNDEALILTSGKIIMPDEVHFQVEVKEVVFFARVNSLANSDHSGITLEVSFIPQNDNDPVVASVEFDDMYDRAPKWMRDYVMDIKTLLSVAHPINYINQCVTETLASQLTLEVLYSGKLLLSIGTFCTTATLSEEDVSKVFVLP